MWPLNGKEIFEIIQNTPCSSHTFENIIIEGILTDSRHVMNFTHSNPNHNGGTLPFLFVAIQGEKFDGHTYLKECFEKGIALALVNRHSSHLKDLPKEFLNRCLLVENVLLSLRKLAYEFRKTFSFPVIGIGGSNGKTTTKEILSSFLSFDGHKVTKTQKSENGFLGIALTLLQKEHKKSDPPHALVLEIGIDEIGAMEKHVQISKPNVVILTALGPEHLTGLKDWDTAAKEEFVLFSTPNAKRIWQLCDSKLREHFLKSVHTNTNFIDFSNDILVIDEKEKHLIDANIQSKIRTIIWEITDITHEFIMLKITERNPSVTPRDDTGALSSPSPRGLTAGSTLFHDKIPLLGKHNAANFALSFATSLALGLTPQNILNGFQHFTPPPQRSKISYLPHDTILFDDTYNASPASVDAALEMLNVPKWQEKKKIIVLGDMLELGNESKFWHENLMSRLKELRSTHLCLFGPAMYNCYILLKENDGTGFREQELAVNWLDADHDPVEFIEKLSDDLKGSIILVKGSRGMRLERFVHCVENFFS